MLIMKKKKIAVFVNGWTTDFIETVLEGIRQEAAKDGVDIFVFLTYVNWGDPAVESKSQLNVFHLPKPDDFDGAIILANTFNMQDEMDRIKKLFIDKGLPVVSTEVKIPGVPFVGTNNKKGMTELCDHILDEHDVKSVVYVSGVIGNAECAIRKATLVESLKKRGLKLIADIRGDYSFNNANVALQDWLNKGNEVPDAFVCANDLMALGVVAALLDRGIRVPEDVIVTGFDKNREGITTYPIIATVSRNWDMMGEYAYEELKRAILNPGRDTDMVYDSTFIPSESCGCPASEADIKIRQDKLRNLRNDFTYQDMQDVMIQNLRLALSTVETKEEFNLVTKQIMGDKVFFGPDFCICVNPWIFDETFKYPKRVRGYHKTLDILYEKKDGISMPHRSFNSRELYPDYEQVEGESNVYMFMPLNYLDMVIGYVAIKNYVKSIYSMSLRRLQADLNPTFVFIKQFISAQQSNRKLKEIYMTDFLTGMYNRTGCETVILDYCKREKKNNKVVLMFADINCMKYINDEYGHLKGDLAIKATAEALRKAVSDKWMFGRFGGDEFIAVGLCEDETELEKLRDNISISINDTIEGMNLSLPLSVSVGYHLISPDDDGTIDDYIRKADESMYEEKQKAHELFWAQIKEENSK